MSLNDDTLTPAQEKSNTPGVRASKRAYSILPNVNGHSNKLFKFSHSLFRRVRSDAYNNNIALDVQNWLPFKDEEIEKPKKRRHRLTIKLVGSSKESLSSELRFFEKKNVFMWSGDRAPTSSVLQKGGLFSLPLTPNDISDIFKSKDKENRSKEQSKPPATLYPAPLAQRSASLPQNLSQKKGQGVPTSRSSYHLARPFQGVFETSGLVSKNLTPVPKKAMPASPYIPNKNNRLLFQNTPMSVEKPRLRLGALTELDDGLFSAKKGLFSPDSARKGLFSPESSKKGLFSSPSGKLDLFGLQKESATPKSESDSEMTPLKPRPLLATPLNLFRASNASDDLIEAARSARKREKTRLSSDSSLVRLPSVRNMDLDELEDAWYRTTPTKNGKNRSKMEPVAFTERAEAIAIDDESLDSYLSAKVGSVKTAGQGAFSVVFECDFKGLKYAVKRTRKTSRKKSERYQKDGQYALEFANEGEREFVDLLVEGDFLRVNMSPDEEISILNSIKKSSSGTPSMGAEYVVGYVSNFCVNDHNYIVTEFCENGALDAFLLKHLEQRMDEFRVWKIMSEILFGLSFLHQNGILHLDLKPANVLIDFSGLLKIGDFGMSMREGENKRGAFEKEGDREYMAPEVLRGVYTRAADIFALGLITVEIAANIYLPDNGALWQKLRSGDLSDAGKLLYQDLQEDKEKPREKTFLKDGQTLDKLVHWMIEPEPEKRPSAEDLIGLYELQYVELKRQDPAVVYEGEYGVDLDMEGEVGIEGGGGCSVREYLEGFPRIGPSELEGVNGLLAC